MAEKWLVAWNSLGPYAVPGSSVRSITSDNSVMPLPHSAEMVGGFFLEGDRLVPVLQAPGAGFEPGSGQFVVCEVDGNLLALPAVKVSGFFLAETGAVAAKEGVPFFSGAIECGEGPVGVLDVGELYKHLGLI